MRIPLRLRSKLAIAFLLVLGLFLAVVIYDYWNDYRQRVEAELQGESRTAEAVGAAVDATFDQGVAVARALAIDPAVRTLDPTRLDPFLARYLSAFPQYESIDVWDASGRNVGAAVSPPPGQPRPDIGSLQHFRQAMATGEPRVSDVVSPLTTGRPTVSIIVPIVDEAGGRVGATSVAIDLEMLSRSLGGVRPRQGEVIFVADPTGRLAHNSLRLDLAWEESDASRYQPVRDALDSGQFTGIVPRSFLGDTRLVATARTPGYGWVAGVSTSEGSALGELQRRALMDTGIYLAAILVAGLLALGLTYAITRPLGDLTRTIEAFGRGELGRRVEVRTGDELEMTADAFNRMASALQREQGRLRFLGEVDAALASSLDLDRVAELLAETSTRSLGEGSYVCILPGRSEDLCSVSVMKAYAPDRANTERLGALAAQHREGMSEELFLPVLRTGQPILIEDLASSALREGLRLGWLELGATSLMVVPLRARGRPVGVLSCITLSEGRRFGREDLDLAVDLAGRAGTIVDNALLFQQVQDERLRLRTILETIPVGVEVVDAPDGRIRMLNPMGRAILGQSPARDAGLDRWPREHGLHRPSGEPYPPDEAPIARTLRRGEICTGEEVLIRPPSGREAYVLVHTAPLRTEDGRLVGGVAAFQDVTPLKEVQRQMQDLAREAERRRAELDAVIEAVGEGITIADGEGRILRINRAGRKIWDYPPLWEERRPLTEHAAHFDLRYPDGRPMPLDQWPLLRALRGEAYSGLEVVNVRKDGTYSHLLFSSGAVRDEEGRLRLTMTVYRDITAIRELERAREEFISVVAHDLRAPITVITGYGSFLSQLPASARSEAKAQKAIDGILSSAIRLEKMVADLLDASRLEARRLALEREPLELPGLASEVVERSSELVKGHPVRVQVQGPIPLVEGDPIRLEQVLTNLLSNAAKYSFPGTEILVEVEAGADEVVVSVTNQGMGVAPEEREEVFTRFHRTRAARSGRASGLGLGLYISRGLVESHGGRIWVEGEQGKYATFRFALPLSVPAQNRAA